MRNFGAATSTSPVFRAAAPYQWLLAFCSLSPPPPLIFIEASEQQVRHCGLRLVFMLHSLLLLALNFWSTYYNLDHISNFVITWHLDTITRVLSLSSASSMWVLQLVLHLTAHLGQRQLRHIYGTLARIERDIRWQCEQHSGMMASVTSSGSLHRRLACCSGMLLLFQFMLLPPAYYILISPKLSVLHRLTISLFGLLAQFKYIEYCVVVQLVHALLLQLQRHLLQLRRELLLHERHVLRQTLYVELRANQRLLARLWRLVDAVEQYYAVPMLAIFLFNGLSITDTVNWLYMHATYSWRNYNTLRIYYITIVVVYMLMPCWLSQCCIETYQEFGVVLHSLKTDGTDVALSSRLREYSLQLMHHRLVFTCGGFFDLNLKYFGTMMLTLITYIIILIQFKLQGEAEKEVQAGLAHIY